MTGIFIRQRNDEEVLTDTTGQENGGKSRLQRDWMQIPICEPENEGHGHEPDILGCHLSNL